MHDKWILYKYQIYTYYNMVIFLSFKKEYFSIKTLLLQHNISVMELYFSKRNTLYIFYREYKVDILVTLYLFSDIMKNILDKDSLAKKRLS